MNLITFKKVQDPRKNIKHISIKFKIVGDVPINDLLFTFSSNKKLEGYIVTKDYIDEQSGNLLRWIPKNERISAKHKLAETINEYRTGTYMFYICRENLKNRISTRVFTCGKSLIRRNTLF